MNKSFILCAFSIYLLFQVGVIQSGDSTSGNVRIASKAPTAQRKSTKSSQVNKAYKAVLNNSANDAQVKVVLETVLVDPEILNQNLKIKLFISIRNLMQLMQSKYGLSTKLNIIDEKLIAKYMNSTFKRLFIGQKIINIDDQINQNSINLLVAVRQNWPEINQMVIGLAQRKPTLIDLGTGLISQNFSLIHLASDPVFKSFSFELKMLVRDMGKGAFELLEHIKKAEVVDSNSKRIKPSESEDKSVALIFTKQNSQILTLAGKVDFWLNWSDEKIEKNQRVVSKAPIVKRKLTESDKNKAYNKAYESVRDGKANDWQVNIVLYNIIVDPKVVNQDFKMKLFISIRNIMISIQSKYGLVPGSNIMIDRLLAKEIDSNLENLLINLKIIKEDDQINENCIALIGHVFLAWPKINEIVIHLAQRKSTSIDLESDPAFSVELKMLIQEMGNGAHELLKQIKIAEFVDLNLKTIKPFQSDDKNVALIFTKKNLYVLTTAAKISLWSKLSDEPLAEKVLENIPEVSVSKELSAIENDKNGKSFDRAKFEKNLADFENQESKKVINPANYSDQPQSIIPQLVTQPESQPESKAQTEKTEKIEEAAKDEAYVPVSSELMNKVASTAHKIASSFVDKQMITQEDLMKVLQNKNLYFEELSNSQNMAYMMGYLQSFVWSLQGDNGSQKRLVKIVEVVRSLKDVILLQS